MTTLELDPITEDGHQTNSKAIQDALSQVGEDKEYDSLHLSEGYYLIDDSVKTGPYNILGINSCSDIYGDIDENGKPTTFMQLMRDAPVKPFGCDVAMIAPTGTVGEDIKLSNIAFDGNCTAAGGKQKYMKAVACPGNHVLAGNETGKSFHNFISSVRSSFKDCEFSNIKISNTAGDGFRTGPLTRSSGLNIHDWIIDLCGHCGIMLENTHDSIVENIKVVTRGNGAFRCQNNCSDLEVKNIRAIGTSQNYNSGFQISGNEIKISKCTVDSMMGCGIEIIGNNDTGIEITECELLNNGLFALTNNYGVAGIMVNGADVLIKDCLFNGNYQNSISTNVYSPDGKRFTKSGYVVTCENNKIIDTKPSKFNVTANGKPVANILQGHTITSKNNWMMPERNTSYNVKFLD
jgi:hypothetical protein